MQFNPDGKLYAAFTLATGSAPTLTLLGAFGNNTSYIVDVIVGPAGGTLFVYPKNQGRGAGYRYSIPAGSGVSFANAALTITPGEGSGSAGNVFTIENPVVYKATPTAVPAEGISSADHKGDRTIKGTDLFSIAARLK